MDNKFFTFIAPYLKYIDKGHLFRKPFGWLYSFIAGINLLVPLYVIYQYFMIDIFEASFKYIIVAFFSWVILAFAGWCSFQLWWDRKDKITFSSDENAEFAATPAFAHFIQTLGEWIGSWIGFVGATLAFFTTILLGDEAYYFSIQSGIPFFGEFITGGWLYIILMPVYGFLIIVLSRFLAEQIKALSVIANNTKQRNN